MGQAYTFSQMPESVASWAAQQQPFVSEYIPPRPPSRKVLFHIPVRCTSPFTQFIIFYLYNRSMRYRR